MAAMFIRSIALSDNTGSFHIFQTLRLEQWGLSCPKSCQPEYNRLHVQARAKPASCSLGRSQRSNHNTPIDRDCNSYRRELTVLSMKGIAFLDHPSVPSWS